MAQMQFDFHPIGTRGFVADAGRSVRAVEVLEVLMVMTVDRGSHRHVVKLVEGAELWHDQYPFHRAHLTREAAAAELAVAAEAITALSSNAG